MKGLHGTINHNSNVGTRIEHYFNSTSHMGQVLVGMDAD
jgi:hypothetical protein